MFGAEKNRWSLDKEREKQVARIIAEFIDKLANHEVTEDSCSRYEVVVDLSDINGVGPYHISKILESTFGYDCTTSDTNGWEMDYWFHYVHPEKPNEFPPLCLSGTGIIHEIVLRGEDDDYELYEDRKPLVVEDKEFVRLVRNGIDVLYRADECLKEEGNE